MQSQRFDWQRLLPVWVVALAVIGWVSLAPRVAGAVDIAWTQIQVPGTVVDVGAGPAGQVWITLTDDRIFQWNGASFVETDGRATRVAVGTTEGTALVVNRDGDGYFRRPTGWEHNGHIRGATDVGFGPRGGVWFTTTAGEVRLLQADGSFAYPNMDAVRVAVDPDLNPWVVKRDGTILHRPGGANGTFQTMPGQALDIAVGESGAVWVTGTNEGIYRWTGTAWDRGPGLARAIAIASDGSPWVVTGAGTLFRGAVAGQGAPPPPPPPPAPAQTTGANRPVLALLCRFADNPATFDITAERIGAMFNGDQGLDGWVREMSYGLFNFANSRGSGWHVLPKNRADYLSGTAVRQDPVSQDCAAAAQAAGVDLNQYFYIAVFINDIIGTSTGTSTIQGQAGSVTYQVGGQPKQIPSVLLGAHGITSPALVLHEFGHLWGGMHTNSGIDPLGGGSYMGDDPKKPKWPLPLKSANNGPGFISFNRDLMGWIPAARKARFQGGTQQFTLTRLTQPAADGSLMLEIPIGNGPGRYTVEVRTRVGFDAATQYPDFQVCNGCFSATQFGFVIPTEGVYIHRIDNPATDWSSTPIANPAATGGIWLTGHTYTDTANNLTIKIDRFDANGAQITVTGPNAAAPPPPPAAGAGNQPADNMTAAGVVTVPATVGPVSTANATEEGGEIRPCGNIGKTMWVRFTATAAGVYTVDTEGSSFDTAIAVYKSAGAATSFAGLTLINCNDDISGTVRQSKITFQAAANETIYIQAGGYNGTTGDLRIRVSAVTP